MEAHPISHVHNHILIPTILIRYSWYCLAGHSGLASNRGYHSGGTTGLGPLWHWCASPKALIPRASSLSGTALSANCRLPQHSRAQHRHACMQYRLGAELDDHMDMHVTMDNPQGCHRADLDRHISHCRRHFHQAAFGVGSCKMTASICAKGLSKH